MNLTLSSQKAQSRAVGVGLWAGACALMLLAHAGSASAQVACDSLPNPIYGVGGSAATPLIKRVARILAAEPEATRVTVVYQDPGACFAMQGLVTGTPITGTAKYWIADQTADQNCTLPTAGVEAQWGAMAQLATTCAGITALPDTVGDYLGPISGFSIVANKSSSQEVISAEALYSIYGLGPVAANIAPWTNLTNVASRTTTSAAGLLLAKAVGLPLTRPLAGVDDKNQAGVIKRITDPAATVDQAAYDSTLGFVATEAADAARDRVKTLAYQHTGQLVGYYPDSTPTATDKVNVREGRYFLWNPHHFFAKKAAGANGAISSEGVAKLISYLTSEAELPGTKPFIDVTIENGNIPTCAMHVTRDDDMGPLASFQPDEPCSCYYDFKATGAAPDSCKACTTDADCTDAGAPKCRLNYCEVK